MLTPAQDFDDAFIAQPVPSDPTGFFGCAHKEGEFLARTPKPVGASCTMPDIEESDQEGFLGEGEHFTTEHPQRTNVPPSHRALQ